MSTHLHRVGFARRFRNAAREFREFSDDGRVVASEQVTGADRVSRRITTRVRSADTLKEVCGVWLIEAHKLKLIPAEQSALVRLIEEHSNPALNAEPLLPGVLMRRVRGPFNLFLDICAGGVVVGSLVQQGGRFELRPDGGAVQGRAWINPGRFVACIGGKPTEVFADKRKQYQETGGFMETVLPGAVQQRPMERCAEACELIADLIEAAVTLPTEVAPSTITLEGTNHDDVFVFAPDGDGFIIKGFGESGHVSKLKGLTVIHRLIEKPGALVPMLELVGADQRVKNDRCSQQPALDTRAKQQAWFRLQELMADLEQARTENDTVTADLTQREIEGLEEQLRGATGIGSKSRDLNNNFDKLRPTIWRQIKAVINALRRASPPMTQLAEHFEIAISSEATEYFTYRSGPTAFSWRTFSK